MGFLKDNYRLSCKCLISTNVLKIVQGVRKEIIQKSGWAGGRGGGGVQSGLSTAHPPPPSVKSFACTSIYIYYVYAYYIFTHVLIFSFNI